METPKAGSKPEKRAQGLRLLPPGHHHHYPEEPIPAPLHLGPIGAWPRGRTEPAPYLGPEQGLQRAASAGGQCSALADLHALLGADWLAQLRLSEGARLRGLSVTEPHHLLVKQLQMALSNPLRGKRSRLFFSPFLFLFPPPPPITLTYLLTSYFVRNHKPNNPTHLHLQSNYFQNQMYSFFSSPKKKK